MAIFSTSHLGSLLDQHRVLSSPYHALGGLLTYNPSSRNQSRNEAHLRLIKF